jgi:hypothetical protein
MSDYGEVGYEGRVYHLTNQATLSNCVFPGWWGDVDEGDVYITEYWASAVDDEGNRFRVVWHFETIKGEEPQEEDYPWDDGHVVRVDEQ